jgi:predicted nucleotidyltransferase
MPTLDEILAKHTRARTAKARAAAVRALGALGAVGVDARLIGSLARDDHQLHSDIDILVLRCPDELRYRIEGLVEDALEGLPFDVVYLDEVAPTRRAALERESLRASDIR